jgi:hypothetical protein
MRYQAMKRHGGNVNILLNERISEMAVYCMTSSTYDILGKEKLWDVKKISDC